MIVISTDLLLTLTPAQANSPAIGYHNLVTTGNVTASEADANYPVTNLANPSTFLEWRSDPGSPPDPVVLTFTTPGTYSDGIDYVGLARHNFGTLGASILVEGDSGGSPAYETIAGPFTPDNDDPLMFKFVADMYSSIRITITPSTTDPLRLAVLYVGKLMHVQRNIYVGHTPITYGREISVVTGRSESGNFFGRIITGAKRKSQVSLQNLTPGWYRSTFDPFVVAAQTIPFFFAWRPLDYPLEVGFCWVTADPVPTNQLPNGMMSVSFGLEGILT